MMAFREGAPGRTPPMAVHGSGVANVPGRPSLRRNEKHNDAECEYRQSHELEYQRIKHGNFPQQIDRLASKRLTVC
jgi:hypothetical protein